MGTKVGMDLLASNFPRLIQLFRHEPDSRRLHLPLLVFSALNYVAPRCRTVASS